MCVTLYRIKTAFFRIYGRVDDSKDMISPDKSLAKSGDMKQANDESATPASYVFWELKSFLIILVVSIRTSVSLWKLWHAAKYPCRFSVNLEELITSIMLKPAQLKQYLFINLKTLCLILNHFILLDLAKNSKKLFCLPDIIAKHL